MSYSKPQNMIKLISTAFLYAHIFLCPSLVNHYIITQASFKLSKSATISHCVKFERILYSKVAKVQEAEFIKN